MTWTNHFFFFFSFSSEVERLVCAAQAAQCGLISFPEAFDWLKMTPQESLSSAQSLDGPLFSRYRALAARHELFIAFGGSVWLAPHAACSSLSELVFITGRFHERSSEAGDLRMSNTHVLVDPAGGIVAKYCKTHMFDVATADGKFRESSFCKRGSELCRSLWLTIWHAGSDHMLRSAVSSRVPGLAGSRCHPPARSKRLHAQVFLFFVCV